MKHKKGGKASRGGLSGSRGDHAGPVGHEKEFRFYPEHRMLLEDSRKEVTDSALCFKRLF